MRATTIKASAGRVAGVVAYLEGRISRRGSAGASVVGYYVDEGEPLGYWWGEGCRAVELKGAVEPGQLANMLEARHPATGRVLGRGFGDSSARAFDCTFSAPKSVSVLWALSERPSVRAEVLGAHDAAVEAALGWLQRHGGHTRRGTDGVFQVDAQGLTVAVFRQHTSRTEDPQLHTHAVVGSKVQDETGRWLSLDARFLKTQQRTIGWIYDAALRTELTQRLGVGWDAVSVGVGQSDIAGISEQARELFSSRSRQVEDKLAELIDRWVDEREGADPDARAIAELERQAAVTSRPRKPHGSDAATLRELWRDQATAAGIDLEHVLDRGPDNRGTAVDREAVIVEAIGRVGKASSTWLQADLAREIATLVPPNAAVGADGLLGEIDELATEAFTRCTELHPSSIGPARARDGRPATEHVTDRLATTTAILEQEERLLAWAVEATRREPRLRLADRPRSAADVMAGTERLVLVVGPAGAGKTTAVRGAVSRLAAQGRTVVGLAPSGKAADVLAREAGCPAQTLARFLTSSHASLPAGTTIVLDEAGMASTEDLDTLVALAERHDWRLVCVGDPEQLPAVGRGGMFAHWCSELPTQDLHEIHRFVEPWQRHASLQLREGHTDAAAAYVEHNRVQTVHPALLAKRVATQYANRSARGQQVAVTTTTADTARAINLEIQRHRTQTGPITRLGDGTTARAGDRIATRRNDPRLVTSSGVSVRNRHGWDVEAVNADGSILATDPDRGSVHLPARYVAEHVELGWAVTGYGNQGITTDHGICVIEPSSTRAGVYVGLTRGRNKNIAVIADSTGTLDPQEALTAAIARPPSSLTAHARQAQLHRSKGLEPPASPTTVRREDAAPDPPRVLDEAEVMRRRLADFAHQSRSRQVLGR